MNYLKEETAEMDQQLFNALFAIAGAMGGWWMKTLWESMKDLQKADQHLAEDVSDLKVLVAGQYVRQESFDKLTTALFTKLDRIEDKVDHKVDKA